MPYRSNFGPSMRCRQVFAFRLCLTGQFLGPPLPCSSLFEFWWSSYALQVAGQFSRLSMPYGSIFVADISITGPFSGSDGSKPNEISNVKIHEISVVKF